MSYPNVESQPNFPRLEQRVLERWERDRTFLESIIRREERGRGRVRVLRRPAVRQRAAALRPSAHRLREGRRAALPDDARPARRAPLRVGLPRPPGRDRGGEGARHRRPARDHQASASRSFNDACRTQRAALHRRVGALRHPAGALGRLRERLQDARPRPTWRASCGRSRRSGTRGSCTRDSGCWRTAGGARRRCRTPRRAWTTSTRDRAGPGGDGRVRARRRDRRAHRRGPPRLDDDAVDAAVQPRPRRRSRRRLRGRRAGRRGAATSSPKRVSRPTQRELGEAPTTSARFDGQRSSSGARYTPLFDFFADRARPNAFQVLAGDTSPPRTARAIVHMAPGFGEDDQVVSERGRHPDDRRRSTSTAGSRPRSPTAAGSTSSTPTRTSSATSRRTALRAPPRDVQPLVSALLALPRRRSIYRAIVVVVRRGHEVPRPHGRAQRADHLGARATSRRQLRQVAGERARLVDQPQPLLGLADPGVAQRRPGVSAHRRLRLARRARARLRRARSTTCTARPSTS